MSIPLPWIPARTTLIPTRSLTGHARLLGTRRVDLPPLMMAQEDTTRLHTLHSQHLTMVGLCRLAKCRLVNRTRASYR